jgi:hypothetical protein
MASFLDRRALKKILDTASAIRKLEGGPIEETASVYLVLGQKRAPKSVAALKTLHAAAVEAFEGRVGREMPDGLLATFRAPIDALRAALHALHSVDLVTEFLDVPSCRVAIAHGPIVIVDRPFRDVSGPAIDRAGKIIGRADFGAVAIEESLYSEMRALIEGHADIEISPPKRGKLPILGSVTTLTIKPIGLKPEREQELLDVDAELRSRGRR